MQRVGLLFGSYRPQSNGRRVLFFLERFLKDLKAVPFSVDAAAYGLTLLEKTYQDDLNNPLLKKLADLYQTLDAFILVSGEYNHLPQPGLLNLLNFFSQKHYGKPSGLVTYSVGAFGGVRTEAPLRTIADTLNMPSIAPVLSIPFVDKVLSYKGSFQEEGIPLGIHTDLISKQCNHFLEKLLHACKHTTSTMKTKN